MFKVFVIVSLLCSLYGNCIGYELKYKFYKDRSLCSNLRSLKDKNGIINNDNNDDSVHNLRNVFCVLTEVFILTNGSLQAIIDVPVPQDVEISFIVYKITGAGNHVIGKETTSLVSHENIKHQQISVEVTATNSYGYGILLGRAADTSSIAVNSIFFFPSLFKSSQSVNTFDPLPLKATTKSLGENNKNTNAVQFSYISGHPSISTSEKIISNNTPEIYTTVSELSTNQNTTPIVTVPFPTVSGLPTNESTTPIVTVPFPTVSGLPTTGSTTPIVTVPFPSVSGLPANESTTPIVTVPIPTVSGLPTTGSTTPIVTVPFPSVSGLPANESTTPIVTVPFPTVSGLPTNESTTPIGTVPFPTVSGLPTTESTTPIVTVPFPTVSGLPTNESTTPIVTVPFPTVSGLPTTESTTPIVTVPFPTVSGLPTTESTTPIVTVPFPTVSGLPTTESTTPIVTVPFPTVSGLPTTESSTPIVTVPFPTVSGLPTTESTTPIDTKPIDPDDSEGLDTFSIVMISVGSFMLAVILGFAGWCIFKSKKTMQLQAMVYGNKNDDLPNLISANKGRGTNMNV